MSICEVASSIDCERLFLDEDFFDFFFLGGLDGVVSDQKVADEVAPSVVAPSSSNSCCLFIVSISDLYRLAAIMMASSFESHTKPWHSSCFRDDPILRMMQANMAGCSLDTASLTSFLDSPEYSWFFSVSPGSLMSGRKAKRNLPGSLVGEARLYTNRTAAHTAMLGNGLKISACRPDGPCLYSTLSPVSVMSRRLLESGGISLDMYL